MLVAAGTLTLPAWAGELAPQAVSGPAKVIDAVTLTVGQDRVVLQGIDAPPIDQTCLDGRERVYSCGRVAAAALATQIGAGIVTCELRGMGPGRARFGQCRVGTDDLAAWMVDHGYAVADRNVSEGYTVQEQRAWGRRVGLWSGVFQMPAEWRRLHGTVAGL